MLHILSSRIVVTVIAATRTFAAQLVKHEPAGLYGLLRPMPSSR
jgi:hypothetical protein